MRLEHEVPRLSVSTRGSRTGIEYTGGGKVGMQWMCTEDVQI